MNSESSALPSDPLAGCAAKVKRAGFHLEALHKAIGPFVKSEPKPYRFVSKIDVETSRYVLHVLIEREPPIAWSLIAGDFVQNARAALDHLVWQLVRANGLAPSTRNAFPIFNQPPPRKRGNRDRERWNAMTRGVHPAALKFMEWCQPYNGPRGEGHILSALQRLSNEDKHRTLLPAFAAIDQPTKPLDIDVVGVRDVRAPVKGGQLLTGFALKSGDLVLEAPVEITGPDPEVELKGELPIDVGFGWKPVPLKALVQIVETVAGIVNYSRRFFGVAPGTAVRRVSTEIDQV